MDREFMISTSEFRNGLVVKIDGDLYTLVEFQHVKPGKGGAFVRTRLKNIKTERVLDRTFRSGDKLEDVRLDRKTVQFLYKNDAEFVFMDTSSYEQFHIQDTVVGDAALYMIDGLEVDVMYSGDEAVTVELPNFMVQKIVKTDPGVKGDTASGGSKPATLESGAVVQVPLFLQEGEKIRVDTRTGVYVERTK